MLAKLRWARWREKRALAKMQAPALPLIPAKPLVPAQPKLVELVVVDNAKLIRRVRDVEALIERTRLAMLDTSCLKDLQAGATALDRLYQTWALLTGHERPAVRRPKKAQRLTPDLDSIQGPDPD